MKQKSRLQKMYSGHRKKRVSKKSILQNFVASMPEIIFRTTKLEGESVTRKMVNALFK